jgi:hypothetical protein
MKVTIDRFGMVIGFSELLQLVTTSKDYALTILHTSQITIGHTRSSQSVTVFTSHCLVIASNSGCFPSSGFPNCPQPQLPASHSNNSQQLNPSGHLTKCNSQLLLLTTTQHRPRGKHHSSVVVYGPLPSNCQLHNSCFEHMCHNILNRLLITKIIQQLKMNILKLCRKINVLQ